jgi:hypothetical protein
MLPCNLLCFLLNLKCLAWLGAQFWYITDCPCYVYAAFLSARELPPFWPLADCVFSLLLCSALLRVHWILCFVFVKIWAIFWCFICEVTMLLCFGVGLLSQYCIGLVVNFCLPIVCCRSCIYVSLLSISCT